jgi:ankyrin repeat protein
MEVLIAAGADLNARNKHDATPLHLGANQSQSDAVLLLLDKGANPDLCDGRGRTVLYKACENHMFSVIGRALEIGADVNIAGNDGKAPLHLALQNRLNDWIDPLLQAGADPNDPMPIPANDGKMVDQTALGVAYESNLRDAPARKRVQLMLVAYGADPSHLIKELQVSPLKAAAMAGLSKRAVDLIEQGESVQISKKHKSLVDIARNAGFEETASMMQAALAKRAIDEMMKPKPLASHAP